MRSASIRGPGRARTSFRHNRSAVAPVSSVPSHGSHATVPDVPAASSSSSSTVAVQQHHLHTPAGRRAILTAAGCLLTAGCFDWPVRAEAVEPTTATSTSTTSSLQDKQVYINIKVDGKPFGRLTFELFPDVKIGSQRFADLCKGKQGVGYRLSKFDNINDSYIRNEGVKALAYNASGQSPIAGGESVGDLEDELAAQSRRHDCAGLVSLVVKPASELPVTEKLVAMGGKLVTVKNQAGEAPNGTAFAITRGPAPELDATNLIVGRLVGGWDVFDNMGALPVINDNQGSPFFKAGKLVGDKRALVAEKSFNKPFGKVVVANGGVVSAGLVATTQ